MSVTELKSITPNDKEFTANGKVYRIGSRLSVNRWKKYLEVQAEFGMGATLPDLMGAFREIYDKANAQKLADIAVLSRDTMIGITNITNRVPQALRLCALFINEDGEDLGDITEDDIQRKADDWTKEGIDVQSFFHLAVASLEGFKESYTAATAIISKGEISPKNKTRPLDTTNNGYSM